MKKDLPDQPFSTHRPLQRRGSVLILVVSLLVLLALMGTAFVVTTRTDRYASRQHTYNVQADMAAQSAVELVVGELSADLFAVRGLSEFNFVRLYRPPTPEGGSITPYENWDDVGEGIIAPRVPVVLDTRPGAAVTSLYPVVPPSRLFPFNPSGINPPLWTAVSGKPSLPINVGKPSWVHDQVPAPLGASPCAPTARPFLGSEKWPHLQVYEEGWPVDSNPDTPEIDPFPAADADGDGIADSFLWRLPMGPMNNVTYYAAVRVIDNNSAINVNTALSRNGDFDYVGRKLNAFPSYFTGRVGLAEMLRTYAGGDDMTAMGFEFNALNNYRFNTARPLRIAGVTGGVGVFQRPFDDQGNGRPDFQFASVGDALERQLGSRIGNPGSSLGLARYRPFTLSDSMALAYRFCLANGSSRTDLEQVLSGDPRFPNSSSLFDSAATSGMVVPVPDTPYSPEEAVRWIERFRYDQENRSIPATFRDLRALLVARNPVANQAPARYALSDVNGDGYRNDMASTLDEAGDLPAYEGGPWRLRLDDPATMRPYYGMEPLNKYANSGPEGVRVRPVPRVPINTASFPELWSGFWSVMTPDGCLVTNVAPVNGNPNASPYIGNTFEVPGESTPGSRPDPFDPDLFKPNGFHNASLMFRSSIRDVVPVRSGETRPKSFTPGNQMLLRAALSAVNTEDLRDADDDVTSRLIELHVTGDPETPEDPYDPPPLPDPVRVAVRVYGTERQPYITEVYVNTDDRNGGPEGASNPKGYIAIELHNPYDRDISLSGPTATDGWSIGLVDRRAPGAPGPDPTVAKPLLQVQNLNGTTSPPACFTMGTVVPANGYLVLENYDPAGADPNAATYRPRAAVMSGGLRPTGAVTEGGVRTAYVRDLHRVIQDPIDKTTGGEFVLLRTRRADGTRLKISDPREDRYNEQDNLCDLIPVDQFDFTGVAHPDRRSAVERFRSYTAVHYVRANGPGAEWKFVYPGRYDGSRATQRHQGMVQVSFGPKPQPEPTWFVDEPVERYDALPVRLGLPDPDAHANQGSFPIQLAAAGWPGTSRLASSGNMYPFGLFGRLADILQVPFIGAYTVYFVPNPGGASRLPPPTPDPAVPHYIYEMNSVSMDSAFAEDTDTTDDPSPIAHPRDQREQIGRFCPVYVYKTPPNRVEHTLTRVDDFMALGAGQYPILGEVDRPPLNSGRAYRFRYRWAMDLFDYFTVNAPQNDFFPNVAPSLYARAGARPPPVPVSNSGGTPGNSDPLDAGPDGRINESNDYAEDLQPIEGLVNINTAPWKVLAALPMVLDEYGNVKLPENIELAKAIVYFRDVDGGRRRDRLDRQLQPHGPFTSIFELNEVVETRPDSLRNLALFGGAPAAYGFRNAYGTINFTAGDEPGVAAGDLSPYRPEDLTATDGVRDDFEEHHLVLNRISNLITTRSDSFTCYVYVMGVQFDGTPNAELKVQRRVAFIADRSGVRPLRPVVRTQFFNND